MIQFYGTSGHIKPLLILPSNIRTRIEGSVKFIHNEIDLGVAFQDEAIKAGGLYFAVSLN